MHRHNDTFTAIPTAYYNVAESATAAAVFLPLQVVVLAAFTNGAISSSLDAEGSRDSCTRNHLLNVSWSVSSLVLTVATSNFNRDNSLSTITLPLSP